MADIKLVIKIDEELKEALDNAKKETAFNYMRVYNDTLYDALKNGIPLDKVLDGSEDDCISRKSVIEEMEKRHAEGDYITKGFINSLPLVTPKPKIGHWRKTPKAVMGEGYMWYCDKCEHQVYQDSSRNYPSEKYCPNCGAKMESEDWVNFADDLIPIMNEIESEE